MQVDYDMYEQEDKYKRKAEYVFAKILKAFFYIVMLVLKLMLEILKNVLRIFKVPIPGG